VANAEHTLTVTAIGYRPFSALTAYRLASGRWLELGVYGDEREVRGGEPGRRQLVALRGREKIDTAACNGGPPGHTIGTWRLRSCYPSA
jgi:hypothetical protein